MCTQPWRDRVAFIVSDVSLTNRPRTTFGYHLYTDDLLWRNFLSPQCRNCSRDHDHAHLESTHSSQDFTWPTRVLNLKSLALAVRRYYTGCKILKRVTWPWPRSFHGRFFFGRVGRAMVSQRTKFEVSRFTRFEAVNGSIERVRLPIRL